MSLFSLPIIVDDRIPRDRIYAFSHGPLVPKEGETTEADVALIRLVLADAGIPENRGAIVVGSLDQLKAGLDAAVKP